MKSLARSIQLTAVALTALLTTAQGSETVLDFVKLQERSDNPPPLRWRDPDTGASIFNLSFNAEGALKGENYLPGSVDLPLAAGVAEAKISLKYFPQSKGAVAVTLTSSDGRQRLRIQFDKSGLSMAWRDRRVEEEPVRFRTIPSFPTGDSLVLELLVDFNENQITVNNGDISEVVKGGESGAPEMEVGEFQKVIMSVEGDSLVQELRIEEK